MSDYTWVKKLYNILDKVSKADKLAKSKEINLTATEYNFLGPLHEWSNDFGFKPKLRGYIK